MAILFTQIGARGMSAPAVRQAPRPLIQAESEPLGLVHHATPYTGSAGPQRAGLGPASP